MSTFLLQFLSDDERTSVEERMKLLLKGLEDAATPSNTETEVTNGHVKRSNRLKELKAVHPPRRSPRKSKPVHSYSPVRTVKITPSKSNGHTEKRKRKVIVPATPDEVIIKKSKSDTNITSEIIKETPSENLRKNLKEKEGKALLQVYVKSEEVRSKRRASRRLSFLPNDESRSSQMISKNSTSKITNSQIITSSTSIKRISSLKSLNNSSINGSIATSSRGSTQQVKVNHESLNAANCLTDAVLQRYRKRMEIVRTQSKKADLNEIFYGRSAGRVNLFSEQEVAKQEEEKRQTRSQTSQKNRSGRKVTQDAGVVYVAHTLLNTHNKTPLLPYKPPKDVQFKIRKLVKHATRADWKKLQKFIQKTQNDDDSTKSTCS